MLYFGVQNSSVSTEAMTNSISYLESTERYNIAVAGANLACGQIFLDNTWRAGYTDMPFNGGTITVSLFDSASGKVMITSIGNYEGVTQKVSVLLNPSSFSKFAMYCGNVSAAAKLRDGDTINGAIHFNNKLMTQGNPVFMQKATMGSLQTTSGTPTFLGGYQTGVNIPFPDYTSNVATIKTNASSGGKYQEGGELWLNFLPGGTVQFKTSSGASWSAAVNVTTFAPNHYICVNNGALHIQGTLQGQLAIGSTVNTGTTPTSTVGATYIENNLRYNTDPLVTPSSTDMLGIVSAGDLTFQVIPIRVDGCLFTNQNATMNSTYKNQNPMKQIKVIGTFMSRNMNSTDFGTGSSKGANFYMKYDTRVDSNPPLSFPFPATSSFEILSWLE
jgi:hypothetical protein